MPNNNLFEQLINEALTERIRKLKISFLEVLERQLEDLFEKNLKPGELRRELVKTITECKGEARFNTYYSDR